MKIDRTDITRFRVSSSDKIIEKDIVAIEEPLQIDLIQNNQQQTYSITMRTPGNDNYLACGLLFAEGVISCADDIESMQVSKVDEVVNANLIEVTISSSVILDLESSSRRLNSHASCGICGKTSLKALLLNNPRKQRTLESNLETEQISKVISALSQQSLFSGTGGSHVAGVVYESKLQGNIELDFSQVNCFEDVGRHNALDKLIGYELIENNLERAGVIILSGRVGFELVQKVVMAGFSTIIALGAPSDLAIKAANQFDVTLIGFAKNHQYNLYTF